MRSFPVVRWRDKSPGMFDWKDIPEEYVAVRIDRTCVVFLEKKALDIGVHEKLGRSTVFHLSDDIIDHASRKEALEKMNEEIFYERDKLLLVTYKSILSHMSTMHIWDAEVIFQLQLNTYPYFCLHPQTGEVVSLKLTYLSETFPTSLYHGTFFRPGFAMQWWESINMEEAHARG